MSLLPVKSFRHAEEIIRTAGRPLTAFCACELVNVRDEEGRFFPPIKKRDQAGFLHSTRASAHLELSERLSR
jgi:hypothetical protein